MDTITVTSAAYDGRYMEVVCRQVADVEANASRIHWTLTVAGGESLYYSSGPVTVTIGGEQVYFCKRKSYTTRAFPAAKGSVSGELTVPHDEMGQCRLTVSLQTAIYTQTVSETTGEWELDTILRTSLVRAADAPIGSCATVVVTRRGEGFSHAIGYRFGALSGWLDAAGDPVAEPVIYSQSILNFRLPESFYGQIPNSPRDTCYLTCETYLGEQHIGSEGCSFQVSADPALCCPVVEGTVSPADAVTLQLTEGQLIPGVSVACCRVAAEARNGAQLVSLTAGDVAVAEGQALLPGWSLPAVPVVAVDSRGFETRLALPSPCIDYVQLTVLPEAVRQSPTADTAVLTLTGVCFSGDFGKGENRLTAVVEFDGRRLELTPEMEEGRYGLEVLLTELAYTRSYPVTVTVSDRAMSVTAQTTVRKGVPVFDWGVGDFRFHVPVDVPALTIGGKPLMQWIRDDG